ncbi:divalent-cation tolerance protein CutA [Niveibacterium sp. 24ML]|uniref:divalent-cation tolerance protein CutA n=1 Tax=Niveibacterium sp. 24ML TaxID=2985512 RepID=UPI00226F10B5|nr:divalent-cation tolerance protein CutA [Niveibacterium sp. 24ML]MCX9156349.1 divalent-cation tolerance protein CutA [Niveibacterium sp. 24ML]
MDTAANTALIVFSTLPDIESAEQLAKMLVERRLAACVSIGAPVTSIYRWEGAIEQACEVPITIKTSTARYPAMQAALLDAHPYDVPELLACAVQDGAAPYLRWLHDATAIDQPDSTEC